jgi:hypothetical protein
MHRFACIVGERQTQRQLLIQSLRNPDSLQNRRLIVRGANLFVAVA